MNSIARGCNLPLHHQTAAYVLRSYLFKQRPTLPIRRYSTHRSHAPKQIVSPSRRRLTSKTLYNTPVYRRFSIMTENHSWWSPPSSPKDEEIENADLESKPMNEEDIQVDEEELLTRRIHMLGVGSIGTFVAHSLKCLPNPPPVTLMMHREAMYNDFEEGGRIVRLVNKKTDINDEQTGYDVDLIDTRHEGEGTRWRYIPDKPDGVMEPPSNPLTEGEKLPSGEVFIYTLIVTVKGPATVRALRSIKHRLDSRSTILFMQNGLGQISALNSKVFTDPETRPTYMIGVISHGAHMQGPFAVVHAGFGTVALGISRDTDRYPFPSPDSATDISELSDEERKKLYPTDKELFSNLSARYLLRTLTRSPILACAPFPYLDLFQLQLEKLVTNCVVNPLTALLDVQNGYILNNAHLTRAQRLLVAEISMVIRGMPELAGVPNVRLRFSPKRLEARVNGLAKLTGENSSSMREDVRHHKNTEIDFLNSYIVRRGEEQGIKCVLNYLMCELVRGKTVSQAAVSQAESEDSGSKNRQIASKVEADVNADELGQSSAGVTLEDRT